MYCPSGLKSRFVRESHQCLQGKPDSPGQLESAVVHHSCPLPAHSDSMPCPACCLLFFSQESDSPWHCPSAWVDRHLLFLGPLFFSHFWENRITFPASRRASSLLDCKYCCFQLQWGLFCVPLPSLGSLPLTHSTLKTPEALDPVCASPLPCAWACRQSVSSCGGPLVQGTISEGNV